MPRAGVDGALPGASAASGAARFRAFVAHSLLVSRRRRAATRAEVHAKVAVRLERREVALHQASRAVYLLVGSAPASVASDFLERYWVHVLAKAVYRHGPDSPAGRPACSRPAVCSPVLYRRPTGRPNSNWLAELPDACPRPGGWTGLDRPAGRAGPGRPRGVWSCTPARSPGVPLRSPKPFIQTQQ